MPVRQRPGAVLEAQLVSAVGGVAAQCVMQTYPLTGHQWQILGMPGPAAGDQRLDLNQRRDLRDVDTGDVAAVEGDGAERTRSP